ncbi:MAG TPA: hypothetical protein DF282_05805, partial [Hyphomonas sp.]|nr:hypothetical protein [Hyphomonas sp.]
MEAVAKQECRGDDIAIINRELNMLVRNLAGMVACLLLGACSATGQNAPTEPTGEQASRAVASKHRVVILTDME